VELRHLRYFIAVAESLHFGQAAATLQIAQPSLSHQIAQLETELQTSLLNRTKRRVELTDAGRILFQEAKEIVARADHAAMIARRMGSASGQRLRVGVGYCTDQSDIAAVIGDFKARHENVQIQTRTLSVPLQLAALIEGKLDVGFVRPPLDSSALLSEIVISEPLIAALPRGHRLVARKRLPLSAFARESFVLPPRDTVPVLHDAVLSALRDAGFVPHSPHEADHLHMMLGMVAAQAGVALVPAAARKFKRNAVVFRQLHPSPPNLETAIAWRRVDQSAVVAEFVRTARQTLARRAQQYRTE